MFILSFVSDATFPVETSRYNYYVCNTRGGNDTFKRHLRYLNICIIFYYCVSRRIAKIEKGMTFIPFICKFHCRNTRRNLLGTITGVTVLNGTRRYSICTCRCSHKNRPSPKSAEHCLTNRERTYHADMFPVVTVATCARRLRQHATQRNMCLKSIIGHDVPNGNHPTPNRAKTLLDGDKSGGTSVTVFSGPTLI